MALLVKGKGGKREDLLSPTNDSKSQGSVVVRVVGVKRLHNQDTVCVGCVEGLWGQSLAHSLSYLAGVGE